MNINAFPGEEKGPFPSKQAVSSTIMHYYLLAHFAVFTRLGATSISRFASQLVIVASQALAFGLDKLVHNVPKAADAEIDVLQRIARIIISERQGR